MKLKHFLIFLVSGFSFLVSGFIFPVNAQHFSSSSYIIDWGNFNITSGRKSSTNYQLTDTVGQNAPGISEKNGIKIKSGFQYIYDTFTELSFTIDKLNIDFGSLTPGLGSTDTNLLTVTTPSGHGYQIMASENHPLWINPNLTIPNTSCDSDDCTPTYSSPWTSADKYGFGFNVTGVGASSYFLDSTHFRPFADLSDNQLPVIVASENVPVKERLTTINYRVLISSLQAAGDYQNYITYTLVPKY
ncbi:MAG: hypothetical protein US68_C0001G0072 [Candidatus Shapirobacteria bacterium GW2011_GWE1_38_10]|uniref:Uncharacterized protein n=1 Tax=Candidatus Shapirobacteria bacterium GW2011_GWE1_38_10 TaxID=1618488 RepID=A0A0G0I6B3_9BACT|nr:MAG: hypothetical protein US46_C0004G0010 [Candidatus Shapirobacteria bacterium GW2011_GWF2_37_20]KKQ50873.1 MAG: hypothetical protein US68_C0001G0072 [Candidatus Shapirobacteria bacterium GW2011_GWE1_38_10]KKQ63641.1 MAG: hypothetical protein US85_C0015G0023 [Candidatus Shapirobacteria bacterium GW2011_GWF1_38_23]